MALFGAVWLFIMYSWLGDGEILCPSVSLCFILSIKGDLTPHAVHTGFMLEATFSLESVSCSFITGFCACVVKLVLTATDSLMPGE